MQPQYARFISDLEVTADGIPNRRSQSVEGVGLGEHRNAQSAGGESTLGGLFNQKHQLVHGVIIARRPFTRISLAPALPSTVER